ncbi:hypothetical protein N0V93_001795 [Gnomoniopsis smithogilvyi]|uniref:Transmembrane protein n=1 Tax=Gnomoniopsis smithogilvyi TaxID=1191159 RepID=A0A9W9D2J0_9PEZI|nr:hypothetical protein N0V93_001795 [Gnomoniopsis smithogilvyi]
MAPHNSGARHQSRDDDSDSIYNHPAIMFFGLLLLCFLVMAPMIWMLWMMRDDNCEDLILEERLNRVRNWKRRRFPQHQQQAIPQAFLQDVDQTVVGNVDHHRLPNVFPKLSRVINHIHQTVSTQSQLLMEKVSQQFISITRAAPRRNRSQSRSRAGVSIDLPIMRQPAWQELASGSSGVTPSSTVGDFSRLSSAANDLADVTGPIGHGNTRSNSSLMNKNLQAQHGSFNRDGVAELRQPQDETTVGLAIS